MIEEPVFLITKKQLDIIDKYNNGLSNVKNVTRTVRDNSFRRGENPSFLITETQIDIIYSWNIGVKIITDILDNVMGHQYPKPIPLDKEYLAAGYVGGP